MLLFFLLSSRIPPQRVERLPAERLPLSPYPPLTTSLVRVYYPDYSPVWNEGRCINTRPLPPGRPTYANLVACCKVIYPRQPSGKCLSGPTSPPTMNSFHALAEEDATAFLSEPPNSPTSIPTDNNKDTSIFLTKLPDSPTPNSTDNSGDAPTSFTMRLNPPTKNPADINSPDGVYYADYAPIWDEGRCINTRPLPAGRPTYLTLVTCCEVVYPGQASGKCLSGTTATSPSSMGSMDVVVGAASYVAELPSPLSTSPTDIGAGDLSYHTNLPSIDTSELSSPPSTKSFDMDEEHATYHTELPSPSEMSLKDAGTLDVYYLEYDECTNIRPVPAGRPTYPTLLSCCELQGLGKCLFGPTTPPAPTPSMSPTEIADIGDIGVRDLIYPTSLPSTIFPEFSSPPSSYPSDRNEEDDTYVTELPSSATMSPRDAGTLNVYYLDYDKCINTHPVPAGRPTYPTLISCCERHRLGTCLFGRTSPPTRSPTHVSMLDVTHLSDPSSRPSSSPMDGDVLDVYYPDNGVCINDHPLPYRRPTFSTMVACCKTAYGGQISGKCLSKLPSPPTSSPSIRSDDLPSPSPSSLPSINTTSKNELPAPPTYSPPNSIFEADELSDKNNKNNKNTSEPKNKNPLPTSSSTTTLSDTDSERRPPPNNPPTTFTHKNEDPTYSPTYSPLTSAPESDFWHPDNDTPRPSPLTTSPIAVVPETDFDTSFPPASSPITPTSDATSPSTVDLLWKLCLLGFLFFSVYAFVRSLLTLLKALLDECVGHHFQRKNTGSQLLRTNQTALRSPIRRVQTTQHTHDTVIQSTVPSYNNSNPDLT